MYPSVINTWGERIRARRLDLGLNVKEAAKLLKTDETCVHNWEKHKTEPQPYFYKIICNFLSYCPLENSGEAPTLSLKIKNIVQYDLGFKNYELALLLGLSKPTVENLLSGKTKPTAESVGVISKQVGYTISYQPDEIQGNYGDPEQTDDLPYKIGSHLYRARKFKKHNIKYLAALFDIHPVSYRKWETNEATPKPECFPKIMDYLGYCPVPKNLTKSMQSILLRVYLFGKNKSTQAKYENTTRRKIDRREACRLT